MIFDYKGGKYPDYLKMGNAAAFIAPMAQFFCNGRGLDVGAGKWPLRGAMPVDVDRGGNAYSLPAGDFDYIFSSHCLEHLPDYVSAIEHWKTRIKPGGVLFLYLPHPDMEYWLPQNNRKHLHQFRPHDIARVLRDLGFINVIFSERDLAWSFAVVGFMPGDLRASEAPERFQRMVNDGPKFWNSDPNMRRIHERFGPEIFRRSSLFDGLDEALQKFKIRGKAAVEIGTYNGITALTIAKYFDTVHSFDILPHTFKHQVKRYIDDKKVVFYDVLSNEEKAAKINSLCCEYDFAYVDGDHANDAQFDWELVKGCGRVLFHEYWEQQKPVWDLVNALARSGVGKVETWGKLAYWSAK